MKKFLAIFLAAVMALGLVACGEPAPAPVESTPVESTPAESAPAESVPVEEPAEDVVKAAAMNYFASFPDDKHLIKVDGLFEKMDAGEDMLIIDVRQPDAYAEGHLKGAVNVPYGPAVADALEMIPDDVPLFVNCYTGQTSSQVVALLNIAGKFATNIQGGFNNGISKAEGFEAYITTDAATLDPEGDYEVEDAIEDAIADYFEAATTGEIKSFNFKPDALKELVAAGDDTYTILSIRKAEDFAAGHIEGAMNIPFGKGMQERFAEIPTDKPVVVYCYSGQTSSQTVATLRMLGYEAYSLAGGMGKEGGSGWLGAQGPVVTE